MSSDGRQDMAGDGGPAADCSSGEFQGEPSDPAIPISPPASEPQEVSQAPGGLFLALGL